MDEKRLKELLDAGAITQEEFDAAILALKSTEGDGKDEKEEDGGGVDQEVLNKLIQSGIDTAMAKERRENAALKKNFDALKKAKLTVEEQAEIERKEREGELLEREKALVEKENKLYAIKAIKEAGLDDGGDSALQIADFLTGADEATTDKNVKAYKAVFDAAVKAATDKIYKENGRDPGKGSGGGEPNPFAKETLNLTKQGQLIRENPELAKQLADKAGVKI